MRLFGGFEVWASDRQVSGFESQKVRALLAYLICHRGRACSRDHLTGLLWPEKSEEAARHALRQAIYNLRSTLPGEEKDGARILTNHLEVAFNPQADLWLDVQAFEDTLRGGIELMDTDPHRLFRAAQLYRGDFLAGFFVRDSAVFEDWMVTERERLRERAAEALRILIDSYYRRGEYRIGIHYARQLVAIEPLSEAAHGDLMRLCALAGRRNQALAQYEELQRLLRRELGVEPLAETRALYESILLEAPKSAPAVEESEPVGPLIPLVGRRDAYARLQKSWEAVEGGHCLLTVLGGEAGVGKTRLIKSFLDATTSRHRGTVLKGRCFELAAPYLPWVGVVRNAMAEEAERCQKALAALSSAEMKTLLLLLPELGAFRPELTGGMLAVSGAGRRLLFQSLAKFLRHLCRPQEGAGEPLVLLFDDFHLADPESFEFLSFLLADMARFPLWVVAVYRSGDLTEDHPLWRVVSQAERSDHLAVERMEAAAIEEIATFLVGEDQASELALFLAERSGGLPLAVAELINFLWDEGRLVARGASRWSLTGSLQDFADEPLQDLDQLILRRMRRLPTSTRRLATLAAVAGHSFEAGLLQEAGQEHPMVIEVGIEVLLKRWLVRRFAQSWTSGHRDHDLVLWAQGARRGEFEFAHKWIRGALYSDVGIGRRQVMHGEIAGALERSHQQTGMLEVCEEVAHHYLAAGSGEKALPYLEMAAFKARSMMACQTARHYCDLALGVLGTMAGDRGFEQERFRRLLAELAFLDDGTGGK